MTEINQEENTLSQYDNNVNIKVIGVGGGGNNTIHSMVKEGIKGVEFIVANTDAQVLTSSVAHTVIQLGIAANGQGAGANPEMGKASAIESEDRIKEVLEGADMVIIAAGMGGGTGTGAAPVIAKIAREMGALTVGVITTPFSFEGSQRSKNAEVGYEAMMASTDSLVSVSNDKLLEQYGGISLKDSFMYADKILKQTVRTITDLIAIPAMINLDFADVTSVMKDRGTALIGIGRSTGDDRAIKAATAAISSPILEASILGATHAIINISGNDITLYEAEQAVETIEKASGGELNIIFGVSIVDNLGKDIQVSVIATGITNGEHLDPSEIKQEVSKAIEDIDLDFKNQTTQEFLIKDPLPEDSKILIDDEFELQNTPFNISDNEDEELPGFLKSK